MKRLEAGYFFRASGTTTPAHETVPISDAINEVVALAERLVRSLREDPQSPRAARENIYVLAGEMERALTALETSSIAL